MTIRANVLGRWLSCVFGIASPPDPNPPHSQFPNEIFDPQPQNMSMSGEPKVVAHTSRIHRGLCKQETLINNYRHGSSHNSRHLIRPDSPSGDEHHFDALVEVAA